MPAAKPYDETNRFRPVQNPYVIDAPIRSADMFHGRQDELKTVENLLFEQNRPVILITGSDGVGKTSLLLRIQQQRLAHPGSPVLINFKEMIPHIRSDETFFYQIVKAILFDKKFRHFQERLTREKSPWKKRLLDLVRACAGETTTGRLILLCDDYHLLEKPLAAGKLTPSALNWMTEAATTAGNGRVCFILSGDHNLRQCLGDASFSEHADVRISLFSEKKTWELITRTAKGHYTIQDAGLIPMIYRLSGGHPQYVQHICHALVERVNEKETPTVGEEDLQAVLRQTMETPFTPVRKIWRRLSWKTRAALAALAGAIREPGAYANLSKIRQALQKGGFPLTPEEFLEATDGPELRDVIDRRQDPVMMRFHPDLMRQWIAARFPAVADLERRKESRGSEKPSLRGGWKIAAAAAFVLLVSGGVMLSLTAFDADTSAVSRTAPLPASYAGSAEKTRSLPADVAAVDAGNTGTQEIEILPGDRVMIRPDIQEPCEGWGNLKTGNAMPVLEAGFMGRYLKVGLGAAGEWGLVCPDDVIPAR